MRILVIQQKMIGDVLTSSILLEQLRKVYPEATLDYLINSHTAPVVEHNPNIDHLILYSKTEENSKKALLDFAKKTALNNYDIVIDVYSKISSNIISYLSKAEVKISYHKWYTSWIYNHNIKRHLPTEGLLNLAIKNRLLLLNPLGITETHAVPKIYLTTEEIEASKTILVENQLDFNLPIYMIGILGSGIKKTYPFDYMAKLLDQIVVQTNGQLLFNYIPNQIEDVKQIYSLCNTETKKHIYLDIFGKSLREFLALTHHCTALIGNEGGAINMAKALDIPTFTIFSPWIDKATWSLFENERNVSIHLNEVKSELYKSIEEKQLKHQALEFYKAFKPEYIKPSLNQFLTTYN